MKRMYAGVCMLCGFFTTIALSFGLEVSVKNYYVHGMQCGGQNIAMFVMALLLFFFYMKIYENHFCKKKITGKWLCYYVPAGLFTIFMLLGESYAKRDNWSLCFSRSKAQILTVIIHFVGYFFLFVALIICIYSWLDKGDFYEKKSIRIGKYMTKYVERLCKSPFKISLITMLFAYVPYILISYPAIFMGDTLSQVLQGFNLPEGRMYYMNIELGGGVYLNNHHPVVHTMLINVCIRLGFWVFESYNAGIFLYSLLQIICFLSTVAYLLKILVEKKVSHKIILVIMLYYVVSPWMQNFMFLVTKDVYYSMFLLWLLILLFKISTEGINKYRGVALFGVAVGASMFRNDGVYVLVLTLLFSCFWLKKERKRICAIIVGICCFSMFFSNVLLPLCHVTPGSKREMLSVPFQQTARYLGEVEDITVEERKAISAVLDYEYIKEKYEPEIADVVKEAFDEGATTEELKEYFKIWLRMFLKHPDIYLQATLNNTYAYFYPEYYSYVTGAPYYYSYEWSEMGMNRANTESEAFTPGFAHPDTFKEIRNVYELIRETFFSFPVMSLLVTPAVYVWCMILWLFYCIKNRNRGILFLIPVFLILAVCIASPVNGWYVRYIYPIAVCIPSVVIFGIYMMKEQSMLIDKTKMDM